MLSASSNAVPWFGEARRDCPLCGLFLNQERESTQAIKRRDRNYAGDSLRHEWLAHHAARRNADDPKRSAPMARTSQNGGPILPGTTKRPSPPPGLDAREAVIWRQVTKRLPPDWINTGAPLFRELCRHIALSNTLMEDIARARAAIDELRTSEQPASKLLLDATKSYRVLLRLHALQSQQIGTLSTKLRLTPQSRYQSSTAKARATEEPEGPEPWLDWGLDSDSDDGQSRKN
jgi:hypothetical protein